MAELESVRNERKRDHGDTGPVLGHGRRGGRQGKGQHGRPPGLDSLRDLLAELDRRSGGRLLSALRVDPELKEVPAFFGVYVNGSNYHTLAGLDTVVGDGDSVVVGTMLAGG